ncbi:MAG: hypothetical protein FWE06_05865 [Oscillospiraceae bacterium]|nr:hypothetical protein [Oscillospiraceae bacterium]
MGNHLGHTTGDGSSGNYSTENDVLEIFHSKAEIHDIDTDGSHYMAWDTVSNGGNATQGIHTLSELGYVVHSYTSFSLTIPAKG